MRSAEWNLALRTPHSALRTRMSPTTFRVGRLTCHAIEGGTVRLDGGAMFGVVPKVLWQRRIPSDERNRIPLAMRCLLIEHPDGLVLVDTGLGNKEDAKFRDIYGVDNAGRGGRTRLRRWRNHLFGGRILRVQTRSARSRPGSASVLILSPVSLPGRT